jgi:hypothetical protein
LYKKFIHRYKGNHSLNEFIFQTVCRCDLVTQDNHRGFDYRDLVRRIDRHFLIEKVVGIQSRLPMALNTQIGIRAKSRYL